MYRLGKILYIHPYGLTVRGYSSKAISGIRLYMATNQCFVMCKILGYKMLDPMYWTSKLTSWLIGTQPTDCPPFIKGGGGQSVGGLVPCIRPQEYIEPHCTSPLDQLIGFADDRRKRAEQAMSLT